MEQRVLEGMAWAQEPAHPNCSWAGGEIHRASGSCKTESIDIYKAEGQRARGMVGGLFGCE